MLLQDGQRTEAESPGALESEVLGMNGTILGLVWASQCSGLEQSHVMDNQANLMRKYLYMTAFLGHNS